MFLFLANASVDAVLGVFLRTWDDSVVIRCLRGLQDIVTLAAFLELDSVVNNVLQALLPQGRGYIMMTIAKDNNVGHSTENLSDDAGGEEDNAAVVENDQNIPFGLLSSSDDVGNVDVTGSAANRGLLALDASFVILRKNTTRITGAWPAFIECLCTLRDARALPVGLSDLDDFADSSGKVLPLSTFAKASQKKLDAYHRSLSETDTTKQKGWFRSFFRKGKADDQNDATEEDSVSRKRKLSAASRALLGITEAADVENIVQIGSSQLPDATIQTLLDGLDAYPFENNPAGEHHAVFTLELAARALLSNRERASDLFILFLSQFERLLVKAKDPDTEIPAPFVIERIVVTILRSSIHLYEFPEVRLFVRLCFHSDYGTLS
jgi:hypothetical protein